MELLLGGLFVLICIVGIWTWATAQQTGSADDYADARRPRWDRWEGGE